MQSAFNEYKKDSIVKQLGKTAVEELQSLTEEVNTTINYILSRLQFYLEKCGKALTVVRISALGLACQKIEKDAKKDYFLPNGLPNLDKIIEDGIDHEVNVDDCDLSTILRSILIIRFISNLSDYVTGTLHEDLADIPTDLYEFCNDR